MTGLSLVIPCYNEADNLPLLVDRLRDVFGLRTDVEILLVNNGSTDSSREVLQRLAADVSWLRVVDIAVNQGYGFGIMSGLAAARHDVLAWTHADLQTDTADALRAFDLWRQAGDAQLIVKGERIGRKAADRFFTFGMQCAVCAILGIKLHDINAQPKLFSRLFYERHLAAQAPHDFSLDLFLLIQAARHGWHVATIPVDFSRRLHGEAKGGGSWKTKLKLMRRTWTYIRALQKA